MPHPKHGPDYAKAWVAGFLTGLECRSDTIYDQPADIMAGYQAGYDASQEWWSDYLYPQTGD